MENFSESVMGVALFLSNMAFWDQSGYFDTAAELKPLLHTWSLAVEEQFYIFFPLLLMGFWRFGTRVVTGALAVISLAILTYAHWAAVNAPNDAFFFILSRAWELLIGSFAAIGLAHWPGLPRLRLAGLLSAVGLICVIVFNFTFDDDTPTPGLWFLLPTGGTALILLFSAPGGPSHRILSLRPMVWIGLISYSAYLWHQPLFAFTRYSTTLVLPVWVTGLLLIATVFLGWLTYLFIETPFRNRAVLSRRTVFKASGIRLLVMLVAGTMGDQSDGFTGRFDYAALPDPWDIACHGAAKAMPDGLEEGLDRCLGPRSDGQPGTFFLLGDSHAAQLTFPLEQIAVSRGAAFGFINPEKHFPYSFMRQETAPNDPIITT